MKLGECKPGDAVRLPDDKIGVVAVASRPGNVLIRLSGPGSACLPRDTEVVPLVPAAEVEEAVALLRRAYKLINSTDILNYYDIPVAHDVKMALLAFLARHERKEGA